MKGKACRKRWKHLKIFDEAFEGRHDRLFLMVFSGIMSSKEFSHEEEYGYESDNS